MSSVNDLLDLTGVVGYLYVQHRYDVLVGGVSLVSSPEGVMLPHVDAQVPLVAIFNRSLPSIMRFC